MAIELSVVIPAYNEGASIGRNLSIIDKAISKNTKSYEIVVVDDGSSDSTRSQAQQASRHGNIRVVGYAQNRGKGGALKFGAQHARGAYVAFLDADLEIGPENIFVLLERVKGGADIAIFSKNHPRSHINFPFYRRLLSKAYYLLAKLLFNLPVSDTQTGCKVFRKGVLDKVLPYVYTRTFAFDLELLAYARDYGYQIAELPLTISFRREKGRIKISNMWRMFLDTVIIFYRYYVKKIHRWPVDEI